MQKITFKYVGILIKYIQVPLHIQFVAGGTKVGRVKIPARKWIYISSSLVPAAYPRSFHYNYEHCGEGPRVMGEGPVLDPFRQGTTKCKGFYHT
jgi:hypothetical protein